MSQRRLPFLAAGLALTASLVAQNNECSGATYLIVGSNGPFTNAGSTTSQPAWPCGNAANDVWFFFQTTASGSVTVDTCGATIDTVMQVFTGNGCGNLVSRGCNDDGCNTASSLTLNVTANSTYWVRVAGYGGVMGTFPVRVQGPVIGGTYAGNTSLGRGCVRNPTSFYELFTNGTTDLNNSSLTMIPSGGAYLVTQSNPTFLAPSPAAIVLPLGDDSDVTLPLSTPMPIPGGTTSSLVVCSNGYVSAGPGNPPISYLTVENFLNAATTAWYVHDDLDPSFLQGGRVKFEQVGAKACITWDGVWQFGSSSATSARTFQFQFDTTTGTVHYVFQNLNIPFGSLLVGYSPGGPSYDGGPIDISAARLSSLALPPIDGLPLTLTASTRPVIGTAWSLDVTNFPASGTLGVDILGFTDPGINDLTSLGMPTCGLRASLDVLNAWLPAGSAHNYAIALPSLPSLIGRHLYTTSAYFAPGINAFGAVTANGIDGYLGDY